MFSPKRGAGMLTLPDLSTADSITVVGLLGAVVAWWSQRSFNRRSERRLEIELSLRSVETLDPEDRAAATLFALTSLGQLSFALELLRGQWSTEKVSRGGAVWVVEQALASRDPLIESAAARLYRDNVTRVMDWDGVPLAPYQVLGGAWPHKIVSDARSELLLAQAILAATSPESEREETWSVCLQAARAALTQDTSESVKDDAAYLTDVLLDNLQLDDSTEYLDAANNLWWSVGGLRTLVEGRRQRDRAALTDTIADRLEELASPETKSRWGLA